MEDHLLITDGKNRIVYGPRNSLIRVAIQDTPFPKSTAGGGPLLSSTFQFLALLADPSSLLYWGQLSEDAFRTLDRLACLTFVTFILADECWLTDWVFAAASSSNCWANCALSSNGARVKEQSASCSHTWQPQVSIEHYESCRCSSSPEWMACVLCDVWTLCPLWLYPRCIRVWWWVTETVSNSPIPIRIERNACCQQKILYLAVHVFPYWR